MKRCPSGERDGICAGCSPRLLSAQAKCLQIKIFCACLPEDLRLVRRVILLRGVPATAGSVRRFEAASRAGSTRDAKKPAVDCAKTGNKRRPICRYFYGSDGTRTRDLRRDRPSRGAGGCEPAQGITHGLLGPSTSNREAHPLGSEEAAAWQMTGEELRERSGSTYEPPRRLRSTPSRDLRVRWRRDEAVPTRPNPRRPRAPSGKSRAVPGCRRGSRCRGPTRRTRRGR
jgi:hypothetical protein